jgi:hypothetical protein
MPDALEQFTRETLDEIFRDVPPEERPTGQALKERLQAMVEEMLPKALEAIRRQQWFSVAKALLGALTSGKELPPDEVLAAECLEWLSPATRLLGLTVRQRLEGLSADELLAALSPEMRQGLARRLTGSGSSDSP